MGADGYTLHRRLYSGQNTTVSRDTTGASGNIVTAKNTNYINYAQRLRVVVTTGASGVTWTVKSTDATGAIIAGPFPVDVATHFDVDFGPKGHAAATGKAVFWDQSATGAAGFIDYEGYQRASGPLGMKNLPSDTQGE